MEMHGMDICLGTCAGSSTWGISMAEGHIQTNLTAGIEWGQGLCRSAKVGNHWQV